MIPCVHLAENKTASTRALGTGRAFRLYETGMPRSLIIAGRVAAQETIIRYLDVEKSGRYVATPGKTYCNVYACDYCHLNGVYLPRVWWMPSALAELKLERPVAVMYGVTVGELNANALYDWLHTFGTMHGWLKVDTLDELQAAANQGDVGVICAAQKNAHRSGHIAVVVPEGFGVQATKIDEHIQVPVQSQAGLRNHCFSCAEGTWWLASNYRGYGFWKHPEIDDV